MRRRHFDPALKALGLTRFRPHDFRRTFIALHVEAGTHPKLVQERMGHSNIKLTVDVYIKLTMDVYGKLTGKRALGAEQAARFLARATTALPVLVNTRSTGRSESAPKRIEQPEAVSHVRG